MKTLIYGFMPYKEWKNNITEKIVKKVKGKNLVKVVFPVRFEKRVFLDKIRRSKPDIIIGLGQHPRGKKIRIERKAMNTWAHSKQEEPRKISKGPKHYFLTAKLKKNKYSWISYNAGSYVCNFSMYIISDFIKNKKIRFAFIHISKEYRADKAAKFVENKIKELQQ
jgi:pyrrolidone-carboxylate peptidase